MTWSRKDSEAVVVLRIKQAEYALKEGQLDKAYELASDADVREHRRGQQLAGRVARALVERSREHLAGERVEQARVDCHKAEKLGGNLSEIAELRKAVGDALENKREQQRQACLKRELAREQIENGRLSAGEQILGETLKDDVKGAVLVEQVQARRKEAEAVAARVGDALKRDELETAVDELVKAGALRGEDRRLAELGGRVRRETMKRIREAFDEGKIHLARSMLNRAAPLAVESLEIQEMARVGQQCGLAAEHLERGRMRETICVLRQLKAALPRAKWIDKALVQSEQAAKAWEGLRAGPLGLMVPEDDWSDDKEIVKAGGDGIILTESGGKSSASPSLREYEKMTIQETQLPSRFLLSIDGVGSYLMVRAACVTVGPVSSQQRPDVGLIAEPEAPVFIIERTDEDYFLRSEGKVEVNDKLVTEKLLRDGDQIALSARCRMKFHVPNPASTSAKLKLSSARYPRADVREVILLDREIVIGPDGSAHIGTGRLQESIILYMQNGCLRCRSREELRMEGETILEGAGLPMEKSLQIGDLSMVLSRI